MDELVAENDKRAMAAMEKKDELYKLNMGTFTIREFINLTNTDCFTRSGQSRINNFYTKFMVTEK